MHAKIEAEAAEIHIGAESVRSTSWGWKTPLTSEPETAVTQGAGPSSQRERGREGGGATRARAVAWPAQEEKEGDEQAGLASGLAGCCAGQRGVGKELGRRAERRKGREFGPFAATGQNSERGSFSLFSLFSFISKPFSKAV